MKYEHFGQCVMNRSCLNLLCQLALSGPTLAEEGGECKSRFPIQPPVIPEMGQLLVTSGSLPNLY